MKAHLTSCLVLVSLLGCAASPAEAAPTCGPNAYRHQSPDFCVELPASARGKDPVTIDHGLSFPGLTINWTASTDAARVAQWKTPAPAPNHHGTFEVLSSEPLTRGTFYLIHDATQHDTLEIFKVPSVRGVAVIEGGSSVVRCTVTISLERGDDARKVAAARAADLAACKSLRVAG